MTLDLSVYLVTDPGQIARRGRSVSEVVRAAVAGGVTAVQVRDKAAPGRAFLSTVAEVAEAAPDRVAVIVNDRVDVYLAARAAGVRVTGVHLGQDDLPLPLVRTFVGPDAVVGLSAATVAELIEAEEAGADYVGIGALHPTATKLDAPPALGIDGFARLASATRLPAIAIGGVTHADMAALRAAGAAGGAVVSAVCDADSPSEAARELAEAWRNGS